MKLMWKWNSWILREHLTDQSHVHHWALWAMNVASLEHSLVSEQNKGIGPCIALQWSRPGRLWLKSCWRQSKVLNAKSMTRFLVQCSWIAIAGQMGKCKHRAFPSLWLSLLAMTGSIYKKCCHSCNNIIYTDSVLESKRFECFVNLGPSQGFFWCENEINVKMKFMDFARTFNRPKPRSSLGIVGNERGFFGTFIGLRAKQRHWAMHCSAMVSAWQALTQPCIALQYD